MKHADKSPSLAGLVLGLSGAVPDRKSWTEPAQDRGILEFVSVLSGLVMKYGGRVVHGGHPTFTPVLLRQAEQFASKSQASPLTIFMSALWADHLPRLELERLRAASEFIVVRQVGKGDASVQAVRNDSLTAMRAAMISRLNVLVAVGGMRHDGTGLIPGVDQELTLATGRGVACFVVGGFGGRAARLAAGGELTPNVLRNGLPSELNATLLSSPDIASCVGLILQHLAGRPERIFAPSGATPERSLSAGQDSGFFDPSV